MSGSSSLKPLGQGAISGIGSIFVQTSSAKLERLNSIVVLFEVDVDGNGNTPRKVLGMEIEPYSD